MALPPRFGQPTTPNQVPPPVVGGAGAGVGTPTATPPPQYTPPPPAPNMMSTPGPTPQGGPRDVQTHQPGNIQGLSPQDYYQGPTWQELLGMGKNPGGKGFLNKMKKRAPGWLQDPSAFNTMMGSINDILNSKGAVDPAVLQRGQADAEAGRAAGAQTVAGNAAMMGLSPDDPRVMAMNQINNQSANRIGSERLRDYEILQEQRQRSDLATMNPIMSFMLQMLHPKSAGNIAPGASAASPGPDYGAAAGGVGNALAAFLNSRGQG